MKLVYDLGFDSIVLYIERKERKLYLQCVSLACSIQIELFALDQEKFTNVIIGKTDAIWIFSGDR